MKIFLVGYMGSGKTTLAKALSERLAYDLIDTDALIESQTGHSISNIFANRGESHFRNLESKILTSLSSRDKVVVSTGGGLPCFNSNMNLVNMHGVSFYIYHKAQNLTDRLFAEKETRPLIARFENNENLSSFVKKHLEEREQYYFQANCILKGDQDIDVLVKDVLWYLEQTSV